MNKRTYYYLFLLTSFIYFVLFGKVVEVKLLSSLFLPITVIALCRTLNSENNE